jgi:SHAQKYF class myb-like DNA-binding protein
MHALLTCRAPSPSSLAFQAWSAAEAEAFAAGLQQHGRDWKAIAAAIGSRDARAVASHAQKHFIKLCLTGVGGGGVAVEVRGARPPTVCAAAGRVVSLTGA